MPRIGVSDLHVAKILTDVEGEETTYDTATRLAGLINIGITKTVAEGELYADDRLDEYVAQQTAQEISINPKDISSEDEALLLGKQLDENGGVLDGGDDNPPEFAVMFRSKKSDGSYQYRVLYRVKFRPFDETYDTQSNNVTFQTPTITGRSMARASDGAFGYKLDSSETNTAVTKAWFTAPAEPPAEEPAGE